MRHLSAQFTTTRNKLENTHTSARNSFKENAQETKKNSYPYNCISFEKLVSLLLDIDATLGDGCGI